MPIWPPGAQNPEPGFILKSFVHISRVASLHSQLSCKKTLLYVLNFMFSFIAINCIQRTPEYSTTEVTLSLDRLNEILGSLTGGSNKTYILTNDRSIYYDDANNNEAFLYNTLRNDYKTHTYKETPTQIWINKAPCPICVNNLDDAFKDRPTQPTIYVETFDYTEATYGKLLESFGCLAKLQNLGYPVRAWNWSTFKAGLQNTDECPNAINTQTTSSNYMAAKTDLERYIGIFSQLASGNTVVDWCQN